VVNRPEVSKKIDWDSIYNILIDPETFEMIFANAVETLSKKIYKLDCVIGANSSYA